MSDPGHFAGPACATEPLWLIKVLPTGFSFNQLPKLLLLKLQGGRVAILRYSAFVLHYVTHAYQRVNELGLKTLVNFLA